MTSPGLDGLQPIEWVDALQKAWFPFWERQCRVARGRSAAWHRGRCPTSTGVRVPLRRAQKGCRGGRWWARPWRVLLASRGCRSRGLPGDPVTATRDGTIIEPFTVVERLAAGKLSAEEWRTVCRDADIAEIDEAGWRRRGDRRSG